MRTFITILFLLSINVMSSDLSKTKTIKYRGGIVNFDIPSDWVEEYEQDGGGTFYEDIPTSGTFRINVLTMKSPTPVKKTEVSKVLSSIGSNNSEIISLPNGNAYKFYLERSVDAEEKITIYYWILAQIIEPEHARIANFSYTILSNQEESSTIKNELQFLTDQIENAVFYPKLADGN